MGQSEQINELAGALAKAQAQMAKVAKTHAADIRSDKGSYKYTYANLADLWEAAREPLTSNGLAIVQAPTVHERGLVLVTTLMHSSGQWVSSALPVESTQKTPQALGSAITYARRYAFGAIVGLVSDEEDDDGAKASKPVPARERAKQSPPEPTRAGPAAAVGNIGNDVEALVHFRERVNMATTVAGVAETMAAAKQRLTVEAYESLRPVGESARARLKAAAA